MNRKLLPVALALATFVAARVQAHTVWIEPLAKDQLVIRFAEPGEDLETSPGHLDSLSSPIAFVLITYTPVTISTPKKSDHFPLTGANSTNVACVETIFTVRGKRKPHFYARWQPTDGGAGTPLLTLDLVPTGKTGEVRAYFRGQPLGDVKATLRAPDKKEQELKTDSEGFLHFDPKQSGQYLLTIAHHRESLAGFHAGQPYEQTSHNAALTWYQP